MAGHAPEFLSTTERLSGWIDEVSDYRLSLYMLATASIVALLFYVVSARVFA